MAVLLRGSSLASVLLLSALCAPSWAFERAVEAPQVSRRQEKFLGGWAIGIAGTECPADLKLCTGTLKAPGCCPESMSCGGLSSTYCCPTETDCLAPVTNFPKCADPSWAMYQLTNYDGSYFCCAKGTFGVKPLTTSYGGLCVADGEVIPAARKATLAAGAKTSQTSIKPTLQTLISTVTNNGVATTITTTATNTVASGAANQSTTPKDTNPSTSPSSSSLGPGPIAGIVIGGLGVLALFLVAFLLYRRRKPAAAPPAPDYSTYAPPPHQQQPDMGVYPTQMKSPALSHATTTAVGSPSPQHVQMNQQQQQPNQQQGYEHYGPPPPAAGYSEVQGQNSWTGPGRVELGPGR